MLKASALVYAIVVSLLIALSSSSLILLSYFNAVHRENCTGRERMIRNARSGINYLLAQSTEDQDSRQRIDLYGIGEDSVSLIARNWGALEVLTATAKSTHNSFTMTAFTGDNFSEDSTLALYLADLDKPLSLCGETILKGTCFLPKEGLKRAYIEGQNFSGDKMVDGPVKESGRDVPPANKALMSRIKTLFNSFSASDTVVSLEEAVLPDTLQRSFSDSTVSFFSRGFIHIGSNVIKGNVKIVSSKKIFISASAVLENAVIAAPEIEVEEKFSGTVQLFAADSILIGENCKFAYPSVIGLVGDEKTANAPAVMIKKGTKIKGVVFAWNEKPSPQKQDKIILQKETEINGQVYSDALVDLQGTVHGSVICQKFLLGTPSAVYENQLLNAVIDRTKLSRYFVGVNLLDRQSHKKIIQWLYPGIN